MSVRWFVLRRLLWTAVAAWLVLSGSFFLFAYTPDPNEDFVSFAAGPGGSDAAVEAYREARNYDEPVLDRYVAWMVAYGTFDWGESRIAANDAGNNAVTAVIVDRSRVTLAYLLPAIVLAVLAGTAVGLYSATHEGSVLDYLGTTVAYSGLGVPNFWLAEALVLLAVNEFGYYIDAWRAGGGLTQTENLGMLAVAGTVLALNLLAVQVRYARAESKEYVPADFVKTVRSTGASGYRVSHHVLRNAAIPLVSLLFTEFLVAVMINVYVIEVVLGIPGVGNVAFQAIERRDIGLVLGTTMLPLLVALLGNLLQDVSYTVLDPRVEVGD